MIEGTMKKHTSTGRLSQWLRCGIVGTAIVFAGCGFFLSEEDRLARAAEAQQRGDFRAATIELKSLLEKNPNNAEARYRLGVVYLGQGDAAASLLELERAKSLEYAADDLDKHVARAHFTLGDYEKTLQIVDERMKVLGIDGSTSERVEWMRMRAEALGAAERLQESKAAYEAAISLAPEDVPALLGLARVTASVSGPTSALAIADKALTIAPQDPEVHRVRGSLQLLAGDIQAANDSYSAALTASSTPGQQVLSLAGLAQAQLEGGKVADAMVTTERMQSLAPNSSMTRYMRAFALVRNGQLDPARELLEKNVANESDLSSRVLLGAVNLALGRLGQAEMYLSSAVAAAPSHSMARQLLAETRLRQSKPNDALDALAPFIASSESGAAVDGNLLALAARASVAAGRTAQGVEYLQRSVDARPDSLDAKLDLAAGYIAAGQPERALAEIGRAVRDGEKADATAPVTDAQTIRREYLAVLARINQGDLPGAVKYAVAVAAAHPTNASLQALASSTYAVQGQFDLARQYAQKVLALRPDEAAGYVAIGRLDLQQGRTEQAADNFRAALDRQAGNISAAFALAMIELTAGRYQAGIDALNAALVHAPNSIELLVLKAQILATMGNLEEAEKLARATVESAPDNASAQAMLGRVLAQRGHHAQAVEALARAVKIAPQSAALRHQFAVAQSNAGNARDALVAANEALRIDGRYLPSIILAAQLQLNSGDLVAAESNVTALAKLAPEQGITHALLGDLRFAQRRFPDAVAAYQRAGRLTPSGIVAAAEYRARKAGGISDPTAPLVTYLDAQPNDVTALMALALEHQTSGALQQAATTYEKVLAQQPDNVVALNNLAWLRFEADDRSAASLAKRAHELAPKSLPVVDTYAWILIGTGESAAGLKLLEPFVATKDGVPNRDVSAEIVAHYALALAGVGRDTDARRAAQSIARDQLLALDRDLQSKIQPLVN